MIDTVAVVDTVRTVNAAPDWAWFYSTCAQSSAAIVEWVSAGDQS